MRHPTYIAGPRWAISPSWVTIGASNWGLEVENLVDDRSFLRRTISFTLVGEQENIRGYTTEVTKFVSQYNG